MISQKQNLVRKKQFDQPIFKKIRGPIAKLQNITDLPLQLPNGHGNDIVHPRSFYEAGICGKSGVGACAGLLSMRKVWLRYRLRFKF